MSPSLFPRAISSSRVLLVLMEVSLGCSHSWSPMSMAFWMLGSLDILDSFIANSCSERCHFSIVELALYSHTCLASSGATHLGHWSTWASFHCTRNLPTPHILHRCFVMNHLLGNLASCIVDVLPADEVIMFVSEFYFLFPIFLSRATVDMIINHLLNIVPDFLAINENLPWRSYCVSCQVWPEVGWSLFSTFSVSQLSFSARESSS